jgi:hypothetical protein
MKEVGTLNLQRSHLYFKSVTKVGGIMQLETKDGKPEKHMTTVNVAKEDLLYFMIGV